jgi:hypothetical protein
MKLETNPETAAAIEAIQRRLEAAPLGATVLYSALSDAAGVQLLPNKRHLIATAIKRLERDTDARFASVVGVGIKRLDAESYAGIGDEAITKTRRVAKRAIARLTTRSNLPPDLDRKLSMQKAHLGVIAHFARPTASRIMETAAEQAGPVDLSQTIKLLGG